MKTFKIGDIEVAANNLGQAKIAADLIQRRLYNAETLERRGISRNQRREEYITKVLEAEWKMWASSPHVEDQYAGTAAVESIARNLGINLNMGEV